MEVLVIGFLAFLGFTFFLWMMALASENEKKRRKKKIEEELAELERIMRILKTPMCPKTQRSHIMQHEKYEIRSKEKWSDRVTLSNVHRDKNSMVVREVQRERLVPMLRTHWRKYEKCQDCGYREYTDSYTDKER